MEATPLPIINRKTIDVDFSAGRGSTLVLEARGLAKSYGAREVFKPFDLDLTDFLAGLASGDLLPEFFEDDEEYSIPRDRRFVPFSDRPGWSFNLIWRVSYGGSSAGAPRADDGEPTL